MSERPVNLPPETQTTSFRKRIDKEMKPINIPPEIQKKSRKKRIIYEAKKERRKDEGISRKSRETF